MPRGFIINTSVPRPAAHFDPWVCASVPLRAPLADPEPSSIASSRLLLTEGAHWPAPPPHCPALLQGTSLNPYGFSIYGITSKLMSFCQVNIYPSALHKAFGGSQAGDEPNAADISNPQCCSRSGFCLSGPSRSFCIPCRVAGDVVPCTFPPSRFSCGSSE